MKTPLAIKVHSLCKSYREKDPLVILHNVHLEVEQGDSIAIIGKSGTGKSTLLHILGTLDRADKGEIEICGKKVFSSSVSSIRSMHIGFMFQAFYLLEDYSLLDNVLMPAKIARHPTHKQSLHYKRCVGLLEQVGLLSKANLLAKHLSGGEKQRAALARALCNDPDILLADEPTGNLDPHTAKAIQALLFATTQKRGKTLILVTHDSEMVEPCKRVYQLSEGTLQQIK